MRPTLAPKHRTILSKPASIAIGLCLLLLGGTLQATRSDAAPGTTSGTTTTSSATGTTTTTKTKTTKHAAHCTYKGTVASVDATFKGFVVHPAKGDDVTLKVNDKTTFSKGKTWDDVKADAKVSGTCHKDGADNWAVTVKFSSPKRSGGDSTPSCWEKGTCPCGDGTCKKSCCG
jgi:hypothetical protein